MSNNDERCKSSEGQACHPAQSLPLLLFKASHDGAAPLSGGEVPQAGGEGARGSLAALCHRLHLLVLLLESKPRRNYHWQLVMRKKIQPAYDISPAMLRQVSHN